MFRMTPSCIRSRREPTSEVFSPAALAVLAFVGLSVPPIMPAEAATPNGRVELAPSPSPLVDFSSASSRNFPSAARAALSLFERSGREIATFAFTYGGEYVIVGTGGQPLFSPGFPSEPRTYVDQYTGTGRQVEVVAFSRTGQWLIIAEDWLRRKNIPSAANSRIRSLQSAGKTIDAFAFSPVDTNGWILVSDGRAYTGGTLPDGLEKAATAARLAKRPIHEVAISHTGEWVLVADDWYATGGLSVQRGFLRTMDEFRTDDRRRIDQVVIKKLNGSLEWAILSNQDETTTSDRMAQIENAIAGQTIYQRMKAHQITGVSLAIVENNRITWRRGYGIRDANNPGEFVYPNTIFEAASISKPIAAFGALQLVQAGEVDLDDGGLVTDLANDIFGGRGARSSRANNATGAGPMSTFAGQFANSGDINLNRLLSHCAGVLHPTQVNLSNPDSDNTGAQRFSPGSTLPELDDMLLGRSPAASCCKPVQTSSLLPGTGYEYSGANFLMVQAVIDQYARGGFDRHMDDLFRDLQMNSTTYDTPAPAFGSDRFARGHSKGRRQATYAYPNKAAASLSTTADDLARFAITLNQGGIGPRGNRVLNRTLVLGLAGEHNLMNQECSNRMANAGRGQMGLGLVNTGNGTWHHGGVHGGYRAFMFARPSDMWALAVLTSGASGDAGNFAAELFRRVEIEYGFANRSLRR